MKNLIQNPEKQLHTLSLHIKEDSTKFSSKLDSQDNKKYFLKAYYNERLDIISINNKVSAKIEISRTKLKAAMNTRLNELRS